MQSNFLEPKNSILSLFATQVWEVNEASEFTKETIVPKGTIGIIFNFSEGIKYRQGKSIESVEIPKCVISGMQTNRLELNFNNPASFLGVYLQPFSVKYLLAVPAGELKNDLVDLKSFNKDYEYLWEQLAEVNLFKKRIDIITNWLKGKVFETKKRERLLCDFFRNSSISDDSVSEIADRICYSTRQFNRKSHELFGFPPQTLIRYKRYLSAISSIHSEDISFTDIALNNGFYDQAHFNRVFKSFTSLTPGKYQSVKSSLPCHIYNQEV